MKEIGSEFDLNREGFSLYQKKYIEIPEINKDYQLLFTGRTAIDFALLDIEVEVNTVYFPSYCCSSMLEPFTSRGMNILFYDVIVTEKGIEYIIDFDIKCDIFFAISYFGYTNTHIDNIINEFKRRKKIVIEDATHRLFCASPFSNNADYVVASLRKWLEIPSGGIIIKNQGKLKNINLDSPKEILISTKYQAMLLKELYLSNYNNQKKYHFLKEHYLEKFKYFNENIKRANEYKQKKIDFLSEKKIQKTDFQTIKSMRITNALYVHSSLSKLKNVELIFDNISYDEDCPLFIPIIVKNGKRDSLKTYLTNKEIYCPIHWPKPKEIKQIKDNNLYENELSLICDQRYSISDMERMVNTIIDFFN